MDAELDCSWLTSELAVGGRLPRPLPRQRLDDARIACVVEVRSEECDNEQELANCGLKLLHLPAGDLQALSQGIRSATSVAGRKR